MRNPLSFRIEAWLGSLLLMAFAGFMVGWLILVQRNFDSDTDALVATSFAARVLPIKNRQAMDFWIEANHVTIPTGQNRYRYLLQQYPEQPWQ